MPKWIQRHVGEIIGGAEVWCDYNSVRYTQSDMTVIELCFALSFGKFGNLTVPEQSALSHLCGICFSYLNLRCWVPTWPERGHIMIMGAPCTGFQRYPPSLSPTSSWARSVLKGPLLAVVLHTDCSTESPAELQKKKGSISEILI